MNRRLLLVCLVLFVSLSVALRPSYELIDPYVPPNCRLTKCFMKGMSSNCRRGEVRHSIHPCRSVIQKKEICCPWHLPGVSNPNHPGRK